MHTSSYNWSIKSTGTRELPIKVLFVEYFDGIEICKPVAYLVGEKWVAHIKCEEYLEKFKKETHLFN